MPSMLGEFFLKKDDPIGTNLGRAPKFHQLQDLAEELGSWSHGAVGS